MKYLIGFVIGVTTTALFFMVWMRKEKSQVMTTVNNTTEVVQTLPKDFNSFYQKFHQDSLYQIAHITFPLEGIPLQADSSTIVSGNYRFQQEDWIIHKDFDTNLGEFHKNISEITKGLIIEQITHDNGQFGMQRRFAKIGEEWNLIYYSAMNRIAAK